LIILASLVDDYLSKFVLKISSYDQNIKYESIFRITLSKFVLKNLFFFFVAFYVYEHDMLSINQLFQIIIYYHEKIGFHMFLKQSIISYNNQLC